jgi:hypothetical protein
MQFLAEWPDAWDEWELEGEEYIDAGERVVAIINQRGRSTASGIPVEMRFAQVWTLRDGQGIRMEMYASPAEALEAVGLSEPTPARASSLTGVRNGHSGHAAGRAPDSAGRSTVGAASASRSRVQLAPQSIPFASGCVASPR